MAAEARATAVAAVVATAIDMNTVNGNWRVGRKVRTLLESVAADEALDCAAAVLDCTAAVLDCAAAGLDCAAAVLDCAAAAVLDCAAAPSSALDHSMRLAN